MTRHTGIRDPEIRRMVNQMTWQVGLFLTGNMVVGFWFVYWVWRARHG